MEIETVECGCCGLREECTQEYIDSVKSSFDGKWLCGLCSEAVREEVRIGRRRGYGMKEAVNAHMSFCGKSKSNPAVLVADGMRQILRRRSGLPADAAAAAVDEIGRSTNASLRC